MFVLLGWMAWLERDAGCWVSLAQPGTGKRLLRHPALAQPHSSQMKKTLIKAMKNPEHRKQECPHLTHNIFLLASSSRRGLRLLWGSETLLAMAIGEGDLQDECPSLCTHSKYQPQRIVLFMPCSVTATQTNK